MANRKLSTSHKATGKRSTSQTFPLHTCLHTIEQYGSLSHDSKMVYKVLRREVAAEKRTIYQG